MTEKNVKQAKACCTRVMRIALLYVAGFVCLGVGVSALVVAEKANNECEQYLGSMTYTKWLYFAGSLFLTMSIAYLAVLSIIISLEGIEMQQQQQHDAKTVFRVGCWNIEEWRRCRTYGIYASVAIFTAWYVLGVVLYYTSINQTCSYTNELHWYGTMFFLIPLCALCITLGALIQSQFHIFKQPAAAG